MSPALLALALLGCARPSDLGPEELAGPLDGELLIASGDVGFDSALLWARAPGPAWLQVEVLNSGRGFSVRSQPVAVGADGDFAATIPVGNLPYDARLSYTVIAAPRREGAAPPADLFDRPPEGALRAVGHLRTAPRPSASAGLTLLVGGGLGGQSWCRPPAEGYRVFRAMAALEPDLFIASGDMIDADGVCPERAPDGRDNIPGDFRSVTDTTVDWTDRAATGALFSAHWHYNRGDSSLRRFLADTPMIAQWGDREVIGDFGAAWDRWYTGDPGREGYPELVAAGREAFFAWNPITRGSGDPDRIYRRLPWGRHAEVFVVDSRSYRDRNDEADGQRHSLLGVAQRDWLVEALEESEATWKIVSADVPISVPTGANAWRRGRDGWANGAPGPAPDGEVDRAPETGFEAELSGILEALDRADVEGLVFVATDPQLARSIRYSVDADGDGDALVFYELLSGPLRGGAGDPQALDDSFGPEVLYAEDGLNSFTRVHISPTPDGRSATLVAEVYDDSGTLRPGSRLELPAP